MLAADFSHEAYRGWLHKGLGRAVLATTPDRAGDLRPILREACLRNVAYDRQCEGSRAAWLLPILRRTGDMAFYAEQVQVAMATVGDDYNGEQLVHLAALLALQGFDDLKPAVRQAITVHPGALWFAQEEQLLIDGLDGLVRVAAFEGARLMAAESETESDIWIELLARKLGRDVVMRRLEHEAESSHAVARYLSATAAQRDWERAQAAKRGVGGVPATLAEVEAALRTEGTEWRLRHVGARMPDELAVAMSRRMTGEHDEDMLCRYLLLFGKRIVPECPERVWELARHGSPDLQYAALCALTKSTDPRKLPLARELLAEDPGVVTRSVLPLLAAGTPDDGALVLDRLVTLAPADADALHLIQQNLGRLVDANAPVVTADLARWAYEHCPCALCREEIVQRLLDLDALDPARREECAHDACADIRKLVGAAPWPYAPGDFQ